MLREARGGEDTVLSLVLYSGSSKSYPLTSGFLSLTALPSGAGWLSEVGRPGPYRL